MELSNQILEAIKAEFDRRIYQESLPRIEQCLSILTEDQIWKRPNQSSNSIGNLVLHLCGNISQYINSGIESQADRRQRDLEFSESGEEMNATQLINRLHEVLESIKPVIDQLSASQLIEKRYVQGFEESVLNILIHVIEHTSYHTGQIAFYTKLLTKTDLKFYGDLDLNIKSS